MADAEKQNVTCLSNGQYDLVVAGHEPTGIYHQAWCRQISVDFESCLREEAQPHLRYRLLNPYQVKLERQKLVARSRKTDPIDLWAISSLLQQGQGSPAALPNADMARLAQYVFLARRAAARLRSVRIELIRQIDLIWPGAIVNVKSFQRAHPDLPVPKPIVESKPLERDTLRVLLEYCPNPYQVRQLGQDGLIQLYHDHHARCGPKTAQRVLACAQRAVLNPFDLVEVYILGLQQHLTDEAHWQTRLAWAHSCMELFITQTPARHLLAIPGLSVSFAAHYLCLVGSPPRFDWPDQVWAFVGFDPVAHQSGDSNPRSPRRISRRGDPAFRQALTWAAVLVASHHPTFGQCFLNAQARGLGYWGAAIHVAHKLNRLCFRLLVEDRPFQDDTHPDDVARWHTYWMCHRRHRRDPEEWNDPGEWEPIL